MTVRWRLSTSSYLRTSLRTSWFCCSTWVCADRIARVTIFDSMGWSSGTRSVVIIDSSIGPLNRRIRSSPSDR